MIQYLYPVDDRLVTDWSGYPINTFGNLYQNIDEGTVSYNNSDGIRNSQSLTSSISYTTHLKLGLGNCHLVPSSIMVLDVMAAASGMVSGLTGNVYLNNAILKNSNSDILGQYHGSGTSWNITNLTGPTYSLGSINLSGTPWKYRREFLNDLNIYTEWSGSVALTTPGNVGFNISAMQLRVSGTTNYLSTQNLKIIDASGQNYEFTRYITNGFNIYSGLYPVSSWVNNNNIYIEDDKPNWWRAVSNGIDNKTDDTYIQSKISGQQYIPYAEYTYYYDIFGQVVASSYVDKFLGVTTVSPRLYLDTPTIKGIYDCTTGYCYPLVSGYVRFRAKFVDDYRNSGIIGYGYTASNIRLSLFRGSGILGLPDLQANFGSNIGINNDPLSDDFTDEFVNYHSSSVAIPYSPIDYTSEPFLPGINDFFLQFSEYNQGYSSTGDTIPAFAPNIKYSEVELCLNFLDQPQSKIIPLYIKGIGSNSSGVPLSISGPIPNSSYLTLYTAGPFTSNSGMSLYTAGPSASNSGISLYTAGLSSSNSGIPLYTSGQYLSSSEIPLYLFHEIELSDSHIPLFLKARGPVTECLTVIDASGYPEANIGLDTWMNKDGILVENDSNWWKSVGSGVHTPNDLSFINPNANIYVYQYPTALRDLRADSTGWRDENGFTLVGYSTASIDSINSGVSTPVDSSYFEAMAGMAGIFNSGSMKSPEILFNKPTGADQIRVRFRGGRLNSNDTYTIQNVTIKNGTGTTLNSFTYNLDFSNTTINEQQTEYQGTSYVDWSATNNVLTFDVLAIGMPLQMISGILKLTEIDIQSNSFSINSPNLYFHGPTLNNVDGGSTACFRMANNVSQFPVELTDITWHKPDGELLVRFPDITVTPTSSYQNFCTGPVYPNYSDITDRTFLTFTTAVPPGNALNNVRFSELEICVTGLDPVCSSYIPLYTYGIGASNSGLDLFIQGYGTQSSGIDLYISGPFTSNSGIPLYVNGFSTSNSGIPLVINGFDISSSGIPLHIQGMIPINSGISLYTAGPIPVSSYMPLFLKTDPIPGISNSIPLFMNSTTNSGIYDRIPMFIQGTGDLQSYIPLYLKGPESAATSTNMPMFLKAIGNLDGSMTVTSGVPLFLGNYFTPINSGIPLYVQVQSGTMGAIPTSASMPLFIARDSEATANNLPMFIKVADVNNSGIPLYTMGAFLYNSGLPLSIPSVTAVTHNGISLYNHGF